VCLSVREDISGTTLRRAIFSKFLCMLPMSVARSSSGMLTIGRIAYRREGGDGSAQRGRSVINDCLLSLLLSLLLLLLLCMCVRASVRVLYYPSYLYLYFSCTFHVCRSAAIFADDVIFPANTHFRCNCQISVVVAVCRHCTCRNCCNN